jgi:hypothetical protein
MASSCAPARPEKEPRGDTFCPGSRCSHGQTQPRGRRRFEIPARTQRRGAAAAVARDPSFASCASADPWRPPVRVGNAPQQRCSTLASNFETASVARLRWRAAVALRLDERSRPPNTVVVIRGVQQSALRHARGCIHLRAAARADDCFSYESGCQPAVAPATRKSPGRRPADERLGYGRDRLGRGRQMRDGRT